MDNLWTFNAEYLILKKWIHNWKKLKTFNELVKYFWKIKEKTLYFTIPFFIEAWLNNRKYFFKAKKIERKWKYWYIEINKFEKNIDTWKRKYTNIWAKFIKNKICDNNNNLLFFDDEIHDFDDEYLQFWINENKFFIENIKSELDEVKLIINNSFNS